MKRMSYAVLAATTLAAGPAVAQVLNAVPRVQVPQDLSPAGLKAARQVEAKLETVIRQLQTDQQRLARLRETVRPDSDEFRKQEAEVTQLSELMDSLQSELQHIVDQDRENQPAILLSRTVTISFKDATVPQALEALQNSSHVPLVVDPAINNAKRLTIQAKNVAVGQVLESIGQQTDLEVTLESGTGAIRVQPWPVLVIDGNERVLKSDTAPWSEPLFRSLTAYGATNQAGATLFQPIDPSRAPALRGRSGSRLTFGGAPNTFGGAPTGSLGGGFPGSAGSGAPMGAGFNPSVPASGPTPREMGVSIGGATGVSLAPIADHMVVIAEPGHGPKGEPGLFLTVYRLEGSQLRRVSQVFHRLAQGGPEAGMMGAPGMYPGMPGAAPGGPPGGAGFGAGFGPGAGGFPGGGGFGGGSGFPGGGGFGGGVPGGGGLGPDAPNGGGGFSGGGAPFPAGGGGAAPPTAPRNSKTVKPKATNPKAPGGAAGSKTGQ